MAKSKKQKTRHLNNSSTELSQAEIWDDSALIRSWEEARKEYDVRSIPLARLLCLTTPKVEMACLHGC